MAQSLEDPTSVPALDDLVYQQKTIRFRILSGTVIGSQKYSETHVHSKGGGGSIGPNGGYVSAPTIYSTSHTRHELWLKDEGGQEYPFDLSGKNIPLREGQHVSLIFGRRADKNVEQLVELLNHNSNQRWELLSASEFLKKIGLGYFTRLDKFIAIFLYFFTVTAVSIAKQSGIESKAITNLSQFAWLGVPSIVYLVICARLAAPSLKEIQKKIDGLLNRLVGMALEERGQLLKMEQVSSAPPALP